VVYAHYTIPLSKAFMTECQTLQQMF
jgi:hypothetical protein